MHRVIERELSMFTQTEYTNLVEPTNITVGSIAKKKNIDDLVAAASAAGLPCAIFTTNIDAIKTNLATVVTNTATLNCS
jgi:hypothetical protein